MKRDQAAHHRMVNIITAVFIYVPGTHTNKTISFPEERCDMYDTGGGWRITQLAKVDIDY